MRFARRSTRGCKLPPPRVLPPDRSVPLAARMATRAARTLEQATGPAHPTGRLLLHPRLLLRAAAAIRFVPRSSTQFGRPRFAGSLGTHDKHDRHDKLKECG